MIAFAGCRDAMSVVELAELSWEPNVVDRSNRLTQSEMMTFNHCRFAIALSIASARSRIQGLL
jgi:hypothetical protein